VDRMKIAAVSCGSLFGETDRNLERIERWAGRLRGENVQIACFPELAVSGYHLSDEIAGHCDPVPGRITERLAHIASLHQMVIIAGLLEGASRRRYITQAVATPERFEGAYRKIHLSPEEQKHFFAGREAPLFQWRGFRFGIGLCFDAHFPELASVYALKGADVIFYAHASPRPESSEEKLARWMRYLPARAYDNGLYVAACNMAGASGRGLDFRGVSMIVNPKGLPLATGHSDGECAAVAEIERRELDAVRGSSMGHFLKYRVPAMYEEITKKREP
jgi:predicted amidohydrolase